MIDSPGMTRHAQDMPRPGFEERAEQRRSRVVAHLASSFEEAERWDLKFWLERTPQERLSALVAIHRDVAAVHPQHEVPVTRWRP